MTRKRNSLKEKRLAAKNRAARMRRLRYLGIAALLLLIIGGVITWRNAGRIPTDELLAATPPNLDGPANAPVRIVEYGDFGCHSCRAWHNAGIKDQLQATFGDQIAFEFRHFPVITHQSPQAAEAAQCAAEQDAFWQYHDYIYEQTPEGALGNDDLKQFATAVGLDQTAFNSCLDSGKYEPLVASHQREAFSAGARGTPTFLINEQPVAFSYNAMATTIDQILQ